MRDSVALAKMSKGEWAEAGQRLVHGELEAWVYFVEFDPNLRFEYEEGLQKARKGTYKVSDTRHLGEQLLRPDRLLGLYPGNLLDEDGHQFCVVWDELIYDEEGNLVEHRLTPDGGNESFRFRASEIRLAKPHHEPLVHPRRKLPPPEFPNELLIKRDAFTWAIARWLWPRLWREEDVDWKKCWGDVQAHDDFYVLEGGSVMVLCIDPDKQLKKRDFKRRFEGRQIKLNEYLAENY